MEWVYDSGPGVKLDRCGCVGRPRCVEAGVEWGGGAGLVQVREIAGLDR